MDQSKPNPKTAKAWPVGSRVRATTSGWTGEVVSVSGITSGSGLVSVRWDQDNPGWQANPFAAEESRVPNPSLVLERIS
jgi:hypothetical protein